MMLAKPKKLNAGDTVALVSLSSGLAGEESILWRTQQGIDRLESVFGLRVKVMPHALKGMEYIYQHPEKRAADLNQAIADPEVKAIVCAIGGNETVRILPYIDVENLKANPKIFTGYSDTTTNHLFFYQHGISTSYGPALLTDFAENIEMDNYTIENIRKAWFSADLIGEIKPSAFIRQHGLQWDEENKGKTRPQITNQGYELLNGQAAGLVTGHLIGGCLEVLTNLRGSQYFPALEAFKGALLFLETSEEYISPSQLEDNLRAFMTMGIFDQINGLLIGKPQNNVYYDEYKDIWHKILEEVGRPDLAVLYNMSFGHNEPKCVLPYGAQAQINTEDSSFRIVESAVID
ncbi:LD-carboxypeptidase [Aerococcaceae bacterium DSM 111020]|nr:LD-carboxypeptidase [Aerococcaceae bacterium DSM 111020]